MRNHKEMFDGKTGKKYLVVHFVDGMHQEYRMNLPGKFLGPFKPMNKKEAEEFYKYEQDNGRKEKDIAIFEIRRIK